MGLLGRLNRLDDRVQAYLKQHVYSRFGPVGVLAETVATERRPGAATLVLQRLPGGWADRYRSYVVQIDGQTVGHIGPGERLELHTSAGRHELWLKLDFSGSALAPFEIAEDQVIRFVCAPAMMEPVLNAGTQWRLLLRMRPWIRLQTLEEWTDHGA